MSARKPATTSSVIWFGFSSLYSASRLSIRSTRDSRSWDTEEGQGGLAAALVVFNDLFGNPKEAVIKPHEYLA
ncbi:hypothetical protein NE555_15835, partial [Alistipes onderdonkii]|nr:hypothetical protein [Alistipes onderdonkii]